MKKTAAILIGSLVCSASAWAYGPYCGPVPRYIPRVYEGCAPAVVVAAPVVSPAPVVYTPPPVVYPPLVCTAPVPVVYPAPACCAPPAVQVVANLPLWPFWHHGGWHRR